ncbi:cytochrome c1 [Aliikangiella marina]|uniref:Cytochrome c1 n=1 Tax=Aliikangiella marina TaxID=1712262 RepID=A0A545T6J8_9GAMM|nr:cytochrome c1 [Aliikangiella marina]TQV72849.1 cytochrome c1 [Aliikangiella marina]
MRKLLIKLAACLSFSLFSATAMAAEAGLTLPNDKLPRLSGDYLEVSMQRGMQIYVNNCLGCHALAFHRYERSATDLGIPTDVMMENMIFSDDKIGDLMTNNMNAKAAANWFGAAPPDLSVVARARGTKWLYNYFRGFYVDDSRPYGVNNSVFKDVGMPHVLEEMQGLQAKTDQVKNLENEISYAQADMANAKKQLEEGGNSSALNKTIREAEAVISEAETKLTEISEAGKYFEIVKEGQLSPQEFDDAMRDLTYFLEYVGEPIKRDRERLGVWVLLFITFFGFVAYLLKKEYWKDIH